METIIDFCNVETDIDLSKVDMPPDLRKVKIENPIILLENEYILIHLFVINGSHRLFKSYKKGKLM